MFDQSDNEYINEEDRVMTIETKYNIGDEVWLMHENMAITAEILEIDISVLNTKYRGLCTDVFFKVKAPYFTREIYESHLFPTKEELLKSL